MKSRNHAIIVACLGLSLAGQPTAAQSTVSQTANAKYRSICSAFYNHALSGSPDVEGVASPSVLARLKTARQGGHTDPLTDLGPPTAFSISDVVTLKDGDAFVCRFEHAKGVSDWSLAYSSFSHSVEDFKVVYEDLSVAPAPPRASPPPAARPQPTAPEEPEDKPPAPTVSEACAMFPDLC